jgi:hypothetical protein
MSVAEGLVRVAMGRAQELKLHAAHPLLRFARAAVRGGCGKEIDSGK